MTEGAGARSVFLPALLGSTALLKTALAWLYPGFLTGDDLEIVATGARWAAGLDYEPWTIRSLLHPLVLVFPVQQIGVLAGLSSARWLTFFACLPTIAFSTLAIALVHRLARRMGLEESAARTASFLFAVGAMPLGYGSTPYARPISGALVLAAFLLVYRASERSFFSAGVLIAAAMTVRWSEGAFLAPLLVLVVLRSWPRRSPGVGLLAGFAAGFVVLVGVFDALTWGEPFASFRAFLDFQRSVGPPNRQWFFYASLIMQWAGPVLILLSVFAIPDPRSRLPLLVVLSVVVLMSFSTLKNTRYVLTAVPFLAIAAAIGWERLRRYRGWGRALALICLVAAAPLGLERALRLLRHKSQSAIAAARFLTELRPAPRLVALEQQWAYGGRLYLGNGVEIRDIATERPLANESVVTASRGADVVALYARDADERVRRGLTEKGFVLARTFREDPSPEVLVFLRR